MAAETNDDRGRPWQRDLEYGQTLYRRATGELPEMESSKSVARYIKGFVSQGDSFLDVGCGAGHYLRSLQRELGDTFSYHGADATAEYLDLARKAWADSPKATFEVADIFSLPFKDRQFDVVISCNLLLHLPSVRVPLSELVRAAKKHVFIRTLVGERSFRIQEVYSPETHPKWFPRSSEQNEFDESGEPLWFSHFNIYSDSYIEKLLSELPGINDFHIFRDDTFDPKRIDADASGDAPPDATRMVGEWQANGYILQPWSIIHVIKDGNSG